MEIFQGELHSNFLNTKVMLQVGLRTGREDWKVFLGSNINFLWSGEKYADCTAAQKGSQMLHESSSMPENTSPSLLTEEVQ